MLRNLWWGEEDNKRNVHWAAWNLLTEPKSMGGMRFRDPKCFNQALVARQAWRLLQKPNSICAKLMKARYYPNGNMFDTVFPKDSSQSWKGVEHGLELLKKRII
jgi:hypothetical protein